MAQDAAFSPRLFRFLKDLAANNDRDWFSENRARYESSVKEPALAFIASFAPRLRKISPHFRADARAQGGSLFRIYRDIRFSKDKSPYKTHTGIQFRHEAGKDAHCPGFYLHLEPGRIFMGAGIWHPDAQTARSIRERIVARPGEWKRATRSKAFTETFKLEGDSLKRPPRGFDPSHELMEDLKRKDFIASTKLTQKAVLSPGFLDELTHLCERSSPLMRFLCRAVGVPY